MGSAGGTTRTAGTPVQRVADGTVTAHLWLTMQLSGRKVSRQDDRSVTARPTGDAAVSGTVLAARAAPAVRAMVIGTTAAVRIDSRERT